MSGGPRGTPPLDLNAVDREVAEWWEYVRTASVRPPADALERIDALLAHARALRAALQEVHETNMTASTSLNFEYRGTPVAQRVAAVLGAAQDGPA